MSIIYQSNVMSNQYEVTKTPLRKQSNASLYMKVKIHIRPVCQNHVNKTFHEQSFLFHEGLVPGNKTKQKKLAELKCLIQRKKSCFIWRGEPKLEIEASKCKQMSVTTSPRVPAPFLLFLALVVILFLVLCCPHPPLSSSLLPVQW